MIRRRRSVPFAAVCALLVGVPSTARAVPYASGVRNTAGTTWEFVLNEPADNVTVLRNGANPANLGALAAGRHTFNMTGFSTFSIEVSNYAPAGWTQISNNANPFANFTIPAGLAINKIPGSPHFGSVYVASSSPTATQAGRAMAEGVYALTADMVGVNASTLAAVADPNDTTQAKTPGFTFDVTTASPWRMAMDDAGNLIISDWSDPKGGLKYAAPDLLTGGLVLEGEFGEPGVTVHGSISSKAYVTGSIGNNLVVQAMDEDLSPYNSIMRWDVGAATSYNQPPTTVIDSFSLSTVSSWINSVNGVRAGAHYSPQHNKWYLVQNRDNGNEAGVLVVEPDASGFSPTVVWDSLVFSQDPNGDFDPADALDGFPGLDGNQDVFRNSGDVTLSPDGTKLLIHRITGPGDNPHLTGAVRIIPLDANGVPDIDVAGGVITNVETITTQGNGLAHSSGAQLEFDAAGNLYVANSGVSAGTPALTGQLVQVFSPGGNTKAVTTSAGAFAISTLAVAAADFDSDGDVDGADFLTWQRNLGVNNGSATRATGDANGDQSVTAADLAVWTAQFGAPPPAAGAVPEPASLALAALAVLTFPRRKPRRPFA